MENQTIHARLAAIKAELFKMKIPKSGKNNYSGFVYHELQDFMPFIVELNQKHGVNAFPKFLKKQKICVLTLFNTDDSSDKVEIIMPYVDAEMLGKGGEPSKVDAIQRLGSTITYSRRYLYMAAYDIVESDGVDAGEKDPPKKTELPVNPTTTTTQATKPKKKVETEEQFTTLVEWVQSGKGTKEKVLEKYDLTAAQLDDLETILNPKAIHQDKN